VVDSSSVGDDNIVFCLSSFIVNVCSCVVNHNAIFSLSRGFDFVVTRLTIEDILCGIESAIHHLPYVVVEEVR
jgi:hypothetical protein